MKDPGAAFPDRDACQRESYPEFGEATNPSFPLVLSSQERESRTSVSGWRILCNLVCFEIIFRTFTKIR